MADLAAITYPLAIVVVVLFGLAACAYQSYREHKQGKPDSPEFFLTARHSVRAFTVAWSFYAAAMGSWALFGPPSYVLTAGVIGMCSYAVSAGIPILIIALLGSVIHSLVPNVLSMGDFVRRRFGLPVAVFVAVLMLFNMGVALTAEYTAVGDLFAYVIVAKRVPIVVIIGVIAMLYTAWGGLYVSIITDQWQALTSILFIVITYIYIWVTYADLDLGPLPSYLGANYYGYASIAVLPISLISSTLFSEAMWQRCWASVDRRTLILGSLGGMTAIIAAVFLLGFGGLLAAWGNIWVPSGPDDYGNTIFFSLLKADWILVIVSLLAVTMSESAIDSLQNAIVDTMSAVLIFIAPSLKKLDLWWLRILVLILNIPPIIVSLQGYNILQLFLLANLITTTSFIPIMLGLWQGPLSRVIVTPFSAIMGCFVGFVSLLVYTAIDMDPGVSYEQALNVTFLKAYDYPPFLLALGFSVVGLLLGASLEFGFRMLLPKFREYPEYDLMTAEEKEAEASQHSVGKDVEKDVEY